VKHLLNRTGWSTLTGYVGFRFGIALHGEQEVLLYCEWPIYKDTCRWIYQCPHSW